LPIIHVELIEVNVSLKLDKKHFELFKQGSSYYW